MDFHPRCPRKKGIFWSISSEIEWNFQLELFVILLRFRYWMMPLLCKEKKEIFSVSRQSEGSRRWMIWSLWTREIFWDQQQQQQLFSIMHFTATNFPESKTLTKRPFFTLKRFMKMVRAKSHLYANPSALMAWLGRIFCDFCPQRFFYIMSAYGGKLYFLPCLRTSF